MNASTKSALLNGTASQVGWFACVLGAAGGWATWGAAVAIALALAHVALAERPEREWPLLVAAGGLGLVADTLHARIGILDYFGHQPGELAPIWIVALWIQFGTVFHFCMRWLSRRYWLAAILGFVGGPLSFLGGERIGAAAVGEPRALSLLLLGLSWSIALPVLVALADRLDGPRAYRIFRDRAGETADAAVPWRSLTAPAELRRDS